MKAFVEGYGCSLNKSDTEKVCGFLKENGVGLVEKPEQADFIVINTCAVKQQTETRMLRRIRQLNAVAESKASTLIVFGCLPSIHPSAVEAISPAIVQVGPSLAKLADFLGFPKKEFSPKLSGVKENSFVSIVPIARGCLGNCSYCCVKNARGKLKSYSVNSLNEKFKKAIEETPEVWLTAEDCGCYGADTESSLPKLIETLLENKGEFRARIGMINPGHLKKFLPAYLKLFSDKRLYRFFHVPLQSGSNKVLKEMNRPYKKEDFLDIVKKIRSKFPDATIATDVIVGFPGETEKQFNETVAVLKKTRPDVVNISRFGARPGTKAAEMAGQLHGRELKKRSRKLTEFCSKISLQRNKRLVGTEQEILVTEKGSKGNYVGRTLYYKSVVIKENKLGRFIKVKVKRAFPTYLGAELASE